MVKCTSCGSEMPPNALFCGFCGAKIKRTILEPSMRNKIRGLKAIIETSAWSVQDIINRERIYHTFLELLDIMQEIIKKSDSKQEFYEKVLTYHAELDSILHEIELYIDLYKETTREIERLDQVACSIKSRLDAELYEEDEYDALLERLENSIKSLGKKVDEAKRIVRSNLKPKVKELVNLASKACDTILNMS